MKHKITATHAFGSALPVRTFDAEQLLHDVIQHEIPIVRPCRL